MAQKRTRTPNVQPNAYPSELSLVLGFGANVQGSITIPQADNLSDAGNVLFAGGIRQGLVLGNDGDQPVDILGSLSMSMEEQALKVSSSGVHQSKNGNATVCFMGVVPFEGDETRDYTVQVFVTHLGEKVTDDEVVERHYNLSAKAWPKPILVGRAAGPQVTGEVDGLTVV